MTRLLTIALILAATGGWAQNDTIIDFPMYQPKREWSIIAYSDSTDLNEIAASLLLPLLNEYAEVCWNDSSLVKGHHDSHPDSDSWYWREAYYKHREPTFSDFIKWLNKWKK